MLPDDRRQRGVRAVEVALEDMAPADRLPFLAHMEQVARREGDLPLLHAIRDWRAQNLPISTEPPASA